MSTSNQEDLRLFLSKVHLKGFKSIEDTSTDFKKGLNILIGKNASGKSNFLECLYHVMRNVGGTSASYKYAKIDFVSSDNSYLEWETEKEIKSNQEEKENFEERIKIKEKLIIDNIAVFNNSSLEYLNKPIIYKDQEIAISRSSSSAKGVLRKIGFPSVIPLYVKFNLPDELECISVPGDIFIQLDNGKIDFWSYPKTLNFLIGIFYDIESSFDTDLDKLKAINKDILLKKLKINDLIKDNLKKYSPIKDVRFNENINIYKDEKVFTIENLKIDFKVNNNWIPWSQLSDGTKRLFYLISEITNKKSGFVLVEEPELGIHPHQFHLLMQFLKEESENKQIIISTHSPQALNYLSEDELSHILIAYYDLKKGTQIKHLTTAQASKAIKYMKLVGFLSDYWMLSDLEP